MFNHILLAFDGSIHAERALAEAIDLARAQHSHLTILTATPRVPATTAYAGVSPFVLEADAEAESETILQHAAQSVPDDVPVDTVLTRTAARDALAEQVETGRYDLLVMGSRGRGPVRSTLLGSVSQHLLNHSTIPILVVHAQTPSDTRERESGVLTDAV